MEGQLVTATWGLVAATSLLFLAAAIPAVGEFVRWVTRKKALGATIIPTLHAGRAHLLEIRSMMLESTFSDKDAIELLFAMSVNARRPLGQLEDSEGLSLDQILEFYVLNSQLGVLVSRLSLIIDTEEAASSPEENYRQSLVSVQAALISLERLDRLLGSTKRKYGGRTFTDEYTRRYDVDRDEAEKQLIDLRRRLKPSQ